MRERRFSNLYDIRGGKVNSFLFLIFFPLALLVLLHTLILFSIKWFKCMQHVGDGGSISSCGWDLHPSCKCPLFQASGRCSPALFVPLPPCVTRFQFQIKGDRKGEPGNKNEIVKRADKFACFISFFFCKSQRLAVIHFTSSITSRDFMTHYLLFPKGDPPGVCLLRTPGPEKRKAESDVPSTIKHRISKSQHFTLHSQLFFI